MKNQVHQHIMCGIVFEKMHQHMIVKQQYHRVLMMKEIRMDVLIENRSELGIQILVVVNVRRILHLVESVVVSVTCIMSLMVIADVCRQGVRERFLLMHTQIMIINRNGIVHRIVIVQIHQRHVHSNVIQLILGIQVRRVVCQLLIIRLKIEKW